jgi:hypothetical protein
VKRLLLLFLIAGTIVLAQDGAQDGPPSLPLPPPGPRMPQPIAPVICDGTEDPCNPNQPWMRGRIEKFCGTAAMLAKLKKEHPDREVRACRCRHKCDPANPHAAMTDDRAWDGRCEARCNPKNCRCPHPCDT